VQREVKPVYVPNLFKLWHSDKTVAQIRKELGITPSQLARLVTKYKLPKRSRETLERMPNDPTEEEIAERAEALRALRTTKNRVSATSHGSRLDQPRRWTAPVYSYSEHTGIFKPMR
jgi:hypothetical protein